MFVLFGVDVGVVGSNVIGVGRLAACDGGVAGLVGGVEGCVKCVSGG